MHEISLLLFVLILIMLFQKPEDWLDDEPEYVPDPNGVKPDDWDEEEDGEWEAPQVGELIWYIWLFDQALGQEDWILAEFILF